MSAEGILIVLIVGALTISWIIGIVVGTIEEKQEEKKCQKKHRRNSKN